MTLTLSPLIPGVLSAAAAGQVQVGLNILNSPTYGRAYSFGNTPTSFGFSGNGTPPEAYAPLVAYQRFGDYAHGTGTDVTKTTQAMFCYAQYFGKTVDDAAECFSAYSAIKDLSPWGGPVLTQRKQVTGGEFIASVEGANNLTGSYAASVGTHIWNGTGTMDEATNFYIGSQVNGGTISNWYGIKQSATPPGIVTNKWGAYLIDRLQTETGLRVAKAGNGMNFLVDVAGSSAFVYAKNPDGYEAISTIRVDALAAQTSALMEFRNPAGDVAATVSAAGAFISQSGAGFIANKTGVSQVKVDGNGFNWLAAALEQTTVGAAGGASALPATPTKYLKVLDHNGTVLVIPAYAAS